MSSRSLIESLVSIDVYTTQDFPVPVNLEQGADPNEFSDDVVDSLMGGRSDDSDAASGVQRTGDADEERDTQHIALDDSDDDVSDEEGDNVDLSAGSGHIVDGQCIREDGARARGGASSSRRGDDDDFSGDEYIPSK
jgi:hypothetical protein